MSVSHVKALPTDDTDKSTMKQGYAHDVDLEQSSLSQGIGETHEVNTFEAAAAAGGKEYRVLGKWKTGMVFIHTEVGLGILSLPYVLSTLGMIPGIIAIIGIGLLATYTAYVYLLFWRRFPHVVNLPDALKVLGGNVLSWIGVVALILNLSLACSSASLTMSVAFNTLTQHSMCTVGFTGFAVLICLVLCMPRTMNFVAYFSGMYSVNSA